MCRQPASVCFVNSSVLEGGSRQSLAERLVGLPDPRHRRGLRHPFVAVLLIAASAVVAGARSYAAIGQWAGSAPQEALTRLGAPLLTSLDVRVAPSVATIRRIIASVCPGGLAYLTGESPDRAESVAADGRSARGSRHDDVPAAHLLAAMTGDGRTVTQLRVLDKTNEITCFAALLEPFDLAGIVVSADALHTQRDHAVFLVEARRDSRSRCGWRGKCGCAVDQPPPGSPYRAWQRVPWASLTMSPQALDDPCTGLPTGRWHRLRRPAGETENARDFRSTARELEFTAVSVAELTCGRSHLPSTDQRRTPQRGQRPRAASPYSLSALPAPMRSATRAASAGGRPASRVQPVTASRKAVAPTRCSSGSP
jgi:predicted transposase YbfD/YdcC